jgi:hypothetical protein
MWSAIVTMIVFVSIAHRAFAQPIPREPTVITQIPLQTRGSQVVVDVMVNGHGPFSFGLDTGASGSARVTKALVERLSLPLVDGFTVSDGSGLKARPTNGVRLEAITLGTVSFSPLTATVLGEGPTPDRAGELWGSLGFELFRDHVVTLDYPAQQLRLAAGQLPPPDGKHVLRYRLGHGSAYVLVDIGGVALEASIDSGNLGGVILPLSLSGRVPLRDPPQRAGRVASVLNEFDLFRAELDGDLRIGDVLISRPTLFFSDLVQEPNIGRGVLRSLAVTFDQPNMTVRFSRPNVNK